MPKISELPALTTANNNDAIAIVETSTATTKRITRGDLLKSPLPANAVNNQAIADKAVTADKIDFATLPKFRVYKDTNNQVLSNGAVTKITFQVVDYNVGSGFSTSTNEFTAPVAGVYEFGARVRFDGGSGTADRSVALQVDGVSVSSSSMKVGESGWSGNCVDQLNLTAGQKVTAITYTDTTGSTARNGYSTNFWGRRVG